MFCCGHWLRLDVFFAWNCQNFSQTLSSWGANIFACLQHHPSRMSRNNWFCHLQLANCESWGLSGRDLPTVGTSQSSRQRWLFLWRVILTTWKPDWCCCWNWMSYCCSPTVQVPKKLGLPQLTLKCCHCLIVADLWSAPSFLSWRGPGGAARDFFLTICHRLRGIEIFLNSYCHVVGLFWSWILRGVTQGDSRFRMRIVLGAVLIRPLVVSV